MVINIKNMRVINMMVIINMKIRRLAILSFLIVAMTMAGTAYAMPEFPYFITGYCENANDNTLADNSTVTAYLERDVNNKTYDVVGPDGENSDTSKYFAIDANLLSAVTGDILIIEVNKTVGMNTYFDIASVIIDKTLPEGYQEAPDMQLKQLNGSHIALIMGKITDIGTGDGVPSADILIECLANTENTSTTSDSQGNYYSVLPCPINATVRVTATKGTENGNETGIVVSAGSIGVEIDVGIAHINVDIPEFPLTAIPALLSMFYFGIMRRFRR